MPLSLSLLDLAFLARPAGDPPPPPFVCGDYTPVLTNLFTPYSGVLNIYSQSEIDLLVGYSGVNGSVYIYDTASITDPSPLNALLEVSGNLEINGNVDPAVVTMNGLRFVGGNLNFYINDTVSNVNGWGFNLTRVNGYLRLRQGDSLTAFGANFLRRLFHASSLIFNLSEGASVSLNGMFGCLVEVDGIEVGGFGGG